MIGKNSKFTAYVDCHPEEIDVKIYFIQKQGEEAETNRPLMDAHLKKLISFLSTRITLAEHQTELCLLNILVDNLPV